MVNICREMGWTEEEYYQSSADFILDITTVLNEEAELKKENTKNNG